MAGVVSLDLFYWRGGWDGDGEAEAAQQAGKKLLVELTEFFFLFFSLF